MLLTTSALGTASHTLTVNGVETRAGTVLGTLTSPSFTYSASPAATSVDIGSPGVAGSAVYNTTTSAWTIVGGGADVWQTSDQCHYLYVPATTSSTAVWIAHIASLTGNSGDSSWSKAGIMARASASTLVADAFTAETDGNDVTFQWTSGTGTAPNNFTTNGTAYAPVA